MTIGAEAVTTSGQESWTSKPMPFTTNYTASQKVYVNLTEDQQYFVVLISISFFPVIPQDNPLCDRIISNYN
jgi:hypothetical protein